MTKFFNKFKIPVLGPFLLHFPNFADKIYFQKIRLSCSTSYRFLAPCQNLEKTYDSQNQRPDRKKDRQ